MRQSPFLHGLTCVPLTLLRRAGPAAVELRRVPDADRPRARVPVWRTAPTTGGESRRRWRIHPADY